nr:unnamed protein product [Callosobruchus chinensis]
MDFGKNDLLRILVKFATMKCGEKTLEFGRLGEAVEALATPRWDACSGFALATVFFSHSLLTVLREPWCVKERG